MNLHRFLCAFYSLLLFFRRIKTVEINTLRAASAPRIQTKQKVQSRIIKHVTKNKSLPTATGLNSTVFVIVFLVDVWV